MKYTDDLCPRGIPLEEAAKQTEDILRVLKDKGYEFPAAAELHLLSVLNIQKESGDLIPGVVSNYVTLRVVFKGLMLEENE